MKLEPFLQPTIRAFHGFLSLGALMEDAFSQHRKIHHSLYWRKSHTAVFLVRGQGIESCDIRSGSTKFISSSCLTGFDLGLSAGSTLIVCIDTLGPR